MRKINCVSQRRQSSRIFDEPRAGRRMCGCTPSRMHEFPILYRKLLDPAGVPVSAPVRTSTPTAITARNATDSYQIPCNTSQIGFPSPRRRRDIVPAFIARTGRAGSHGPRCRPGNIIYRRRVVVRSATFRRLLPPTRPPSIVSYRIAPVAIRSARS